MSRLERRIDRVDEDLCSLVDYRNQLTDPVAFLEVSENIDAQLDRRLELMRQLVAQERGLNLADAG